MSNYWSVQDIANLLNITPQAIYKQKQKYIEKGYIESVDGVLKVNLRGYNHFLENSKHNIVVDNKKEVINENNNNEEYINFLKNRVEQLENELRENKENYQKEIEQERNRTNYFKNLFEIKDKQLISYMLPSGESNKLNRERTEKKSIFERIFGN